MRRNDNRGVGTSAVQRERQAVVPTATSAAGVGVGGKSSGSPGQLLPSLGVHGCRGHAGTCDGHSGTGRTPSGRSSYPLAVARPLSSSDNPAESQKAAKEVDKRLLAQAGFMGLHAPGRPISSRTPTEVGPISMCSCNGDLPANARFPTSAARRPPRGGLHASESTACP